MIAYVFSINIHEKVEFFFKQIKNITEHVDDEFVIILNTNDYMNQELQNYYLSPNIVINPEVINKRRFHGSLAKGIYSNMKYAINNFDFRYFKVLSSRTFFHNKITPDILENSDTYDHDGTPRQDNMLWWRQNIKTNLAKIFLKEGKRLYSAHHEGLGFKSETCRFIIDFMEEIKHIQEELFNAEGCIEEFAFQSIAMMDRGFYQLKDRCKIVHKIERI